MSNDLPPAKRRKVLRLLLEGQSVRGVANAVGCAKNTVLRYRAVIQAAELLGDKSVHLPTCECGQPAGHRGWCAVRYAKSPKRQEFIRRWRKKDEPKP